MSFAQLIIGKRSNITLRILSVRGTAPPPPPPPPPLSEYFPRFLLKCLYIVFFAPKHLKVVFFAPKHVFLFSKNCVVGGYLDNPGVPTFTDNFLGKKKRSYGFAPPPLQTKFLTLPLRLSEQYSDDHED